MKKIPNLFSLDEPDENIPDRDQLPYFHKIKGGGNISQFLKQQYESGYTGAKRKPIKPNEK